MGRQSKSIRFARRRAIATEDREFLKQAAAWVTRADLRAVDAGLEPDDALRRAPALLLRLRNGSLAAGTELTEEELDVIHAVCEMLERPEAYDLGNPLADAENLYRLIEEADWPGPDVGERTELMADIAFAAWRLAQRAERAGDCHAWLRRFREAAARTHLGDAVGSLLATPIEERTEKAAELRLDDAELLLAVCEVLRARVETSPAVVRDDAEFFYRFLEKPKRKVGLFDEREYYMGELALLAGCANRVLFHREEARQWFERAEVSFTLSVNGLAHIARLGYQRLALALEERRLDEVLELAPVWMESFESMEMAEDALKCRFLEGIALREMGEFAQSIELFREICRQAEEQRNVRLIAQASNNLAQYCRLAGDLDGSLEYARKALPLLKQLDNRVGLVKLRWSVGNVLREQGNLGGAVAAYREALAEARDVGMRGDVAALHLVLADVLLDAGQDRQAQWEVRAALPIIEEEKMVPEGFAALSLLRESLRRHQQIDRKALRELHGYFPQG